MVATDHARALLARSGDRCEVPGCALDTYLECAHVESHADGGSRKVRSLLRVCHVHHTQFDAGFRILAGWSRRVFGWKSSPPNRTDLPADRRREAGPATFLAVRLVRLAEQASSPPVLGTTALVVHC
jgi:hypothetical protein